LKEDMKIQLMFTSKFETCFAFSENGRHVQFLNITTHVIKSKVVFTSVYPHKEVANAYITQQHFC